MRATPADLIYLGRPLLQISTLPGYDPGGSLEPRIYIDQPILYGNLIKYGHLPRVKDSWERNPDGLSWCLCHAGGKMIRPLSLEHCGYRHRCGEWEKTFREFRVIDYVGSQKIGDPVSVTYIEDGQTKPQTERSSNYPTEKRNRD